MEVYGGGNCGCGYAGTCYVDFVCGCSYDHGQMMPCAAHGGPAIVAETCPVCRATVSEAHPKYNVWVHDECLGEYFFADRD